MGVDPSQLGPAVKECSEHRLCRAGVASLVHAALVEGGREGGREGTMPHLTHVGLMHADVLMKYAPLTPSALCTGGQGDSQREDSCIGVLYC